jgi:hypothetical protein
LGAWETLLRGGNGSIFHEVPLIYKMAALLFYQVLVSGPSTHPKNARDLTVVRSVIEIK